MNSSIYLNDLSLPATSDEAADILWSLLDEAHAIKQPQVKLAPHECKKQMERIKDEVKAHFSGHPELDQVVDSVFGIIEGSIGMIYKLENKKTTAKFIDIIRKYFHDHNQHAPEGLNFFIELGLEVIADLVEKKDPPAWFEVLAITVLGVLQMVAGAIIKAYLPIAGELIGNALMSTGMDDIMFAITSAVSGEFSWDDYAAHKVESLKSSIISSAISCGVSFGVSAVQMGSVGKAWDVQKLSAADKALKAGQVVQGSFNLGTYVLKEVGRSLITTGISQIASRGLQGMASLIAGSYADQLKRNIQAAVNNCWSEVQHQALALHTQLKGDSTAYAKVEGCMQSVLKRTTEGNFFDGALRASRQVLPQASSLVGKGWGTFLSCASDIAQLGVSIPKLVNLVEDNTRQFARDIRATKERNAQSSQAASPMSVEDFNAKLEKLKTTYTDQMDQIFNGILNSAVYAPLVSLGTKKLVEAGSHLISTTEQEQLAQSPEMLSKIIDAENNQEEAFFDRVLRQWRHAESEVTHLSEKELQQVPANAAQTIEALKAEYGNALKIYKDENGVLYAQRPTRMEYAQSIREGKASGDPEIGALSKKIGKGIALIQPDGKIKSYSYSAEGQLLIRELSSDTPRDTSNTLYLDYQPDTGTGVGHVKLQGDQEDGVYSGNDCLYEAIKKGASLTDSISDLRNFTAQTLDSDASFKSYYHQWSLSQEPKDFVGSEPLHLWTRLKGGIGLAGSLGEFALGGALTVGSYGALSLAGLPIMAHGGDNIIANWKTLYSGQEADPYTVRFLENQGLSHTSAVLFNDAYGVAASLGGSYMLKSANAMLKALELNYELTIPADVKSFKGVDFEPTLNPLWTNTKKKTSIENAFGHWNKHRIEFFGEINNSKEYVETARELLTSPPAGTLYKIRPNGEIVIYHHEKNLFGVFTKEGIPKTLMKPNPYKRPDNSPYFNLEYFFEQ